LYSHTKSVPKQIISICKEIQILGQKKNGNYFPKSGKNFPSVPTIKNSSLKS